jgi:hypothetical protein
MSTPHSFWALFLALRLTCIVLSVLVEELPLSL